MLIANGLSERPRPVSPAETIKSKGSRGILRFSRKEHRRSSAENKASTSQVCGNPYVPVGTTPFFGEIFGPLSNPTSLLTDKNAEKKDRSPKKPPLASSSSAKVVAKSAPMSACTQTLQQPEEASGSKIYTCILCPMVLSSKGVCKRHLAHQHLFPDVFECERCQARFDTKANVKKHLSQCGAGVFSYQAKRPDAKRLYACEFTGEYFSSPSRYLEHLVNLCGKSGYQLRPNPSRKLRAFLSQPGLRSPCEEMCERIFRSRDAWRSLRWDKECLAKAVNQLEDAIVHDNGTIEFEKVVESSQRFCDTRAYVKTLLSIGRLPEEQQRQGQGMQQSTGPTEMYSSQSSHSSASAISEESDVTPTHVQSPETRATSRQSQWSGFPTSQSTPIPTPSPLDPSAAVSGDAKGKRPLSDQSRFWVPSRRPPGPPLVAHSHPNLFNTGHCSPIPPQMAVSDASTVSLPYRGAYGPGMVHNVDGSALGQTQPPSAASTQIVVPSDAASESTLALSYHDPELIDSIDYNYWAEPYGFTNDNANSFPEANFYHIDEASSRTMSVATGQTYVDSIAEEPKFMELPTMQIHPIDMSGTFFLDDDEHLDGHGMG